MPKLTITVEIEETEEKEGMGLKLSCTNNGNIDEMLPMSKIVAVTTSNIIRDAVQRISDTVYATAEESGLDIRKVELSST